MCTLRGTASSMNGMYCSRNNGNGLLCSARSVIEVLWDVQYSLFSLQGPECEGLLGARPSNMRHIVVHVRNMDFAGGFPQFSGIVIVPF